MKNTNYEFKLLNLLKEVGFGNKPSLKLFELMNRKLSFSLMLFLASITVFGQTQTSQDRDTRLRGQGINATYESWWEFPTDDPSVLEVWGYTNKMSYSPGDDVQLHVNTTADEYEVVIYRDGGAEEIVYQKESIKGKMHTTPKDAYKVGCGWPVSHTVKIPKTWKSGGYVVNLKVKNSDGVEREQYAFFVLKAENPGAKAKIALVTASGTWWAYNDWGGSNYYEGVMEDEPFSPALSNQRPWAAGLIWNAKGSPRIPIKNSQNNIPIGWVPRYPTFEYAKAQGYSKYYIASGWANYEALFARWAEKEGYEIEYMTMHDVHNNPEILKNYEVAVVVGHDEYWTREMRLAFDSFVEEGGYFARFAANFIWQTRMSDDETQVSYKYRATEEDPVRNDPDKKHLLTGPWEGQTLNWPSSQTVGANGMRGTYSHLGGFQPRGTAGYTVFRPKHWAYDKTDLYYGDNFGGDVQLVGYEVDGITVDFKYGLPYPNGEDGTPKDVEIIALSYGGTIEEDHGNKGTQLFAGDADARYAAKVLYGETTPENMAKVQYGNSVISIMPKGKGEVFCAATTEWVVALQARNAFVEQITKNVLNKYTK